MIKNDNIRPIRYSHLIRGQIEVDIYGREYLEEHFFTYPNKPDQKPIRCIPQMTFIDSFGLYRNMYRTLLGFYIIPSNMTIRERTRLANIFPIALGPHGAEIEQTIECLKPAF
ncbi:hypothetical protein DFH27DRAFT_488348 [Peziza echinospora]|nr:hypothetical protein DFH27DRAFT_488348 [Peziza echinospora]